MTLDFWHVNTGYMRLYVNLLIDTFWFLILFIQYDPAQVNGLFCVGIFWESFEVAGWKLESRLIDIELRLILKSSADLFLEINTRYPALLVSLGFELQFCVQVTCSVPVCRLFRCWILTTIQARRPRNHEGKWKLTKCLQFYLNVAKLMAVG